MVAHPSWFKDEEIRVLVDPCVGDWIPGCELCGEDIATWDEMVLLPFSTIGADDEPARILPCHRSCPNQDTNTLRP